MPHVPSAFLENVNDVSLPFWSFPPNDRFPFPYEISSTFTVVIKSDSFPPARRNAYDSIVFITISLAYGASLP